jgi:hypothetical protein
MTDKDAIVDQTPVTPPPIGNKLPRFGEQVDAHRTAQTANMDGDKAKIAGKVGVDLAAANNEAMLRAAQKVAITLGADGVVTIDDVTRDMANKSYNVLPKKNSSKRHNWKGKVFPISKWVKVGEIASTLESSHGRPVGQWVTKAWLRENSMNGRVSSASGYALIRVFKDFERLHKAAIAAEIVKLEDCNWFIGDERIDNSIRKDIQADGNKMYGVPVSFIPGAIGAMLLPPDPSKFINPPPSGKNANN